ncbi:hypothetical protein BOTBODRAFT_51700 [Botryobasidium botryosum FD-172 SS1]|uniref:DH domain-containing protein n=1 Tax=Botryobasidium botryosum (strain FD-172 SS1) TaxID=930990 RepID=A0A067N656_BOTB1|nr:hypothetical protein BOTBODRAFT_51700 [Botryobasidium botryosum FD-172 SS1]
MSDDHGGYQRTQRLSLRGPRPPPRRPHSPTSPQYDYTLSSPDRSSVLLPWQQQFDALSISPPNLSRARSEQTPRNHTPPALLPHRQTVADFSDQELLQYSGPQEAWAFPEPQIYPAGYFDTPPVSEDAHYSDVPPTPPPKSLNPSHESVASVSQSFDPRGVDAECDPIYAPPPDARASQLFTEELVSQQEREQNGILRFQAGTLPDADAEWHRLVSPEAVKTLPKKEVQRQSVLFEIVKSEKEYVSDLRVFRDVFMLPLISADPPVITPPEKLEEFIVEVFQNVEEILATHEPMLADLYERQREQHPLILGVTDIILDYVFRFQPVYDQYVKHYPISEAQHRKEVQENPAYKAFLEECSKDPGVKKRDLITFISRPVTKLPRLHLLLETLGKRSEPDNFDQENLLVILPALDHIIKATEPGIAAAEAQVKLWSFCESLVFQKAEIVDMDLYSNKRTLIKLGTLARRMRNEVDWSGWVDLTVGLLDNYLIMTRPGKQNGAKVLIVLSRPIPIGYLRIGPFELPAESRKESDRSDLDSISSEGGGGSILDSLRAPTRPVYPFMIYHAKSTDRRYTFYADSEEIRKKWKQAFVETIGIWRAEQEANKVFALEKLTDGFFRTRTALVPETTKVLFLGRITSAASFFTGGQTYLVVSCAEGIYAEVRGPHSAFRKVLDIPGADSIVALPSFKLILVQHNGTLASYSLDILARVAQGQSKVQTLKDSREVLADSGVQFFRVGVMTDRTVVAFAVKRFIQVNFQVCEAINVRANGNLSAKMFSRRQPTRFKPYSNFYVPRNAFDVILLERTIAVACEKVLVIIDPARTGREQVVVSVPDFSTVPMNEDMRSLKDRCDASRAIGFVQSGKDEFLAIFEGFGCFVTKRGAPTAVKAGFAQWEIPATDFAFRPPYILLFSNDFVEVRDVATTQLVQIIAGKDIRLAHGGPASFGPVMFAMRGEKDDQRGVSDKLVEVIETAPIPETPLTATHQDHREALWEGW